MRSKQNRESTALLTLLTITNPAYVPVGSWKNYGSRYNRLSDLIGKNVHRVGVFIGE